MGKKVDLNSYKDFVQAVTSAESNAFGAMNARMQTLSDANGVSTLLLTGAIGMASEGGEFAEIVKKCILQGKNPMDNETVFYCKRELGDIMWYWINSCPVLVWTNEVYSRKC